LSRGKIVCTIGPASENRGVIGELIREGMSVARLNFSHGTHRSHREVLKIIRDLDQNVAVMQDLQGPKIRVGRIKGGEITLDKDQKVVLTTEPVEGDAGRIPVKYAQLAEDVEAGDSIYLADGTIHLEVLKPSGNEVECRVLNGGVLRSRKGVNLPGVKLSAKAFTEKDREDLEFGLKLGVDFVALSFVRSAAEVLEVKKIIEKTGSPAQVIAKIEKGEALDSFEQILDAADGIMIARGDLGVEIPAEKVPVVQKKLIKKCLERGKPVITATQMLVSMTGTERPTRAEASDVANAVLDGTDALMLSEETATGKYPVESVRMMRKIIEEMEKEPDYPYYREEGIEGGSFDERGMLTDAVCLGATDIASRIEASAIAVLTHTGKTARMISRRRPSVPLLVLCDFQPAARRMALVWGAEPVPIENIETTDKVFARSREKLARKGLRGKIVLTAGIPTRERKQTNTVHVIQL